MARKNRRTTIFHDHADYHAVIIDGHDMNGRHAFSPDEATAIGGSLRNA